MRKTINNALVQTIRCFLYSICKKWFSTEHRFCQNLHSVNFVPFIRFVKVFERRQNATKKSNTTRTQRENRKRIWGRGGRLSCGRGHARSEPLNGKRHCGVQHQRGQDPGKTTRRLKQRARGRRDERLPRGNHKRKQFTHTCSDKQWTEESATTKTSDPWPHRGNDIRRDAFPSETCKAPPCGQEQTWCDEQASGLRFLVYEPCRSAPLCVCRRMRLQHLDGQKPR